MTRSHPQQNRCHRSLSRQETLRESFAVEQMELQRHLTGGHSWHMTKKVSGRAENFKPLL
jgi:hypothetical protein